MEKLPLSKRVKIFIIENLIYLTIFIISLTCKKKFSFDEIPKKPVIVVFWHGRLAMMSLIYKQCWKQRPAKVMISDHKDGEIITRVISHFGIGAIRGSSSKNAARALISAFRELDNGVNIVITPDGPRGPFQSVADGAAIIAQKKNTQIVAINYEASSFWKFKSWDKMILPKPFSKINFSISKPFSVANMDIKDANEKIKNELLKAGKNDKRF